MRAGIIRSGISTITVLIFTTTLVVAFSIGPSEARTKSGTLVKKNFTFKDCHIEEMTVKYRIKEQFGAPSVGIRVKWKPGTETDKGCLHSKTMVYLKTTSGGEEHWLKAFPIIPKGGMNWGMSSTTSFTWDNFFCGLDLTSDCISAEAAKKRFKEGYGIDGFEIR